MTPLLAAGPAVDAPGWGLAFAAGLISLASPCVAPLIPGYMAYISGVSANGQAAAGAARRVVSSSLLFVLGFTFIFVLLGSSATSLSTLLRSQKDVMYQISGGVMIAMGLLLMGLLRVPLLMREHRPTLNVDSLGPAGPVVLGMAFAIGWTPCIGPILATILLYASTAQTAGEGGLLLFVYSLGFGLPLVLAALAWTRGPASFDWLRRRGPLLTKLGGAVIVVLGALFLSGQWFHLNVWAQRLYGDVLGLGAVG